MLYDVTRFAGLQVFLQAICGGSVLIIPDVAVDLRTRLNFLRVNGCNALSATPSLWRKLLMLPAEASELSLSVVAMGGEIADDRLLKAIAEMWPSARIRHIYASTEAGVGFSVGDVRAGFPVAFLADPPAGVALRVDSEGMLWLLPQVGLAPHPSHAAALDPGWIRTGDLVKIEGDRVFFRGRENGAINVGGNKVLPEEVTSVILQVPGVAEASVVPRSNPFVGQVVEARVVPEPGVATAPLHAAILAECRSRLPSWQVPASVKFEDDLAVSTAGKTLRA
jgi:acyl-CoA synthetase (AMP-forming)/AMP-acid ligase II